MSDKNLEKILIIDDNSDYRKLINTFISKLLPGVEVLEYDPVFEGVPDDDFDWSGIDVLLLDYHLSIVGTTGLDILHKHHKKSTFPATIMLTGAGTEEIAIRALKSGIYEYQPKQTLTKDKLKQSIIHAWEEKKSERKKKQEITQHNRSFSKEVFYENLENTFGSKGPERALVIIRPDNVEVLEEEIGIIGRDSLVNYIAKNSFDVFKLGACNPNITRISDSKIGVQIDYPINKETLEFNMQGLCKNLAKCNFKFSEEKYNFSVSIGVLKLGIFNKSAEQLIYICSTACDHASKTEGNSYYIWKDTDVVPELIDNSEKDVEEKFITSTLSASEKEKLEADLKANEEKAIEQAQFRTEQEAKDNADAEAQMKAARKEKEKLEAELKAREEKAKEQARLRAEQEAKDKADAEAEMKAARDEKDKLEAELKAREEKAKEEKEKLEAELKVREEEAKEQARLRAEQEAREKADAEAKINAAKEKADAEAEIKAAKEEKVKLEAELKAREEEAKEQARLRAEQETREKANAEAKINAAKAEKEKLEAELKAREEEAKEQARLHAEKEAKEKADAEATIKTIKEEKEKLEAELKAREEEAKEQTRLRNEQEAKEKANAEATIKAAREDKEKLEAELKEIAKAKAEAESEMKAAKEEKEKLEAELKAMTKAKTEAEAVKTDIKPADSNPESENKTSDKSSVNETESQQESKLSDEKEGNEDEAMVSGPSLEEIENQIKKLIDEKKIIQTYQPVTAMFDDEDEVKEIYKTGLQAITDGDKLNEYLSNTLAFSIPLQQTINEWILRQVFLRITESGTTKCQYMFLITVTESWFSDITLFQWLQKILSQTKKYNPGNSIILDVPLNIFSKHQKRAEALINTLRKSHQFTILLSNINAVDNILEHCSLTSSSLLMVDIEQLKKLSETLTPNVVQETNNKEGEETEKQNLLQYLKSKKIRIITTGIENSTLLTDAITAGTDYILGNFVGEVQDNLVESSTVESFELT